MLSLLRILALLAAPGVAACAAVEKAAPTDAASDGAPETTTSDAPAADAPLDADTSVGADSGPDASLDTADTADTGPCDATGDFGTVYSYESEVSVPDGGRCQRVIGAAIADEVRCPPGWTCTNLGCVESYRCAKQACGVIHCANADRSYCQTWSSPPFCQWIVTL